MPSTIETLERELGEAQAEREKEERSVLRAENAHEAACSTRDEAWSEGFATDPQVERLTTLVYTRRRELYEAIDRLQAAEGPERRIQSRPLDGPPAARRPPDARLSPAAGALGGHRPTQGGRRQGAQN